MEVNKATVLQVVTGLGIGGAERVVIELSDLLPKMGYASVVAVLNDDDSLLEQYPDTRTTFHFLRMAPNLRSLTRAINQLKKIVRKERVTIIHAHMFHSLVLAILARGFDSSCKIVFTSHSSKVASRARRLFIWLSRPLRAADIILQKCQHVRLNAARTEIIPNGVPLGDTLPIKNRNVEGSRCVFLFLGRLERVKNPITLVQKFSKMQHVRSELWLAGDGYLRDEVAEEIEKLGITDRVRLLGICQDIPFLLSQVDCLVMVSLWEGLPISLLEAGAAGLPVIATKVGAIPELLEDDCGYLVDVDQVSEALDRVAENYAEAARRGSRLMKKVATHYTADAMVKSHANLYSSVNFVANSNDR